MRKILFLIVFITVLAIPVMADKTIIDAQNTTSCNYLGFCETTLDLTKYITSDQINIVKTIDINKRLPVLTSTLTSINYRIENNTHLIIYGYIKKGSSNYWTSDIDYFIIDPYWNDTYNGTWVLGSGAGMTQNMGIQIYTNSTFTGYLFSIGKDPNHDGTGCELWNQTATITNMVNGSFVGNLCEFSTPTELKPNEYYFITTSGGTTRTISGTAGFPIDSDFHYNITGGVFYDGSWHNDAKPTGVVQAINIYNITIQNYFEDPVPEGSYIICTDNSTLFNNRSIVTNGVLNNTQEYTNCIYGCDNVTQSCYPAPFIQDIITFAVLCFIAGITVILFNWLR